MRSPLKPPHEQPSDDLGQYYWWSEEARDHRTITIQQEQKRTPP